MSYSTSDDRTVLTIEEAAKLLRIGRGAAYAAANAGQLPVIRIGRTLRVPRYKLAEMFGELPQKNDEPRAANPELVKKADDGGHHEFYSG